MSMSKAEEYERLVGHIKQWNVDHYDIFELSEPNENLEFHGVVRFFFQGGIGASVITKCIRVSSTATTREVIDVLIEKFRPDMRMLSEHKYALYEVHVNGEERRLAEDEKPLFVQLNWGEDVREGRFLLRNEDHPTVRDPALGFDKSVMQQDQAGFKRKLSKRERKEKRKRDRGKENTNGDDSVANKLYEAAPETSFTRSISNPEAVMRRRRQQKLERKLAQMNAGDGSTDSGGTLKIYGESLRPDVPYKTLFLSTADPASCVVWEAMEKYGLEMEDPAQYCLVEVLLPPGGLEYHGQKTGDERVLDDNECPLAIVIQHAKHRGQGHIIFQLRRRLADYKKRQKPRSLSSEDLRNNHSDHRHTNVDMLPYLMEVNARGKPKQHVLPLNVTEVVNVTEVANNKTDYAGKHFLQLSGLDIHPRHCVIAHTEGIVTVTPNSHSAETFVEGQRIYETTMLKHGMMVQFGKDKLYRFLDPRFVEHSSRPNQLQIPDKPERLQPPETGFVVNGVSGPLPHSDAQVWESQQRRSAAHMSPGLSPGAHGIEDLLPASVEFFVDAQDHLLQAVVLDVNSRQLQFKLAPTYSLYMAVRYLLVTRSPVSHRDHLVAEFVNKTAQLMQQCIQRQNNDPSYLAFWMANASEMLHMFKQDRDISPLSVRTQEILAETVQTAFHHLVRCLQGDLQRVMPAFLDPSDSSDRGDEIGRQYSMGRPTLTDILDTLSAAMTLLRRCRVNAALTIQLFSQLFHFINMWLFNILVTEPQMQLCSRVWGLRLKRRLGSVEVWAEKQGLELAADCHLCRIIQAAHLLQAPKATSDDVTNISSTCFKLNSIQLRTLLTHYIPELNEPTVSQAFIERVVSIAENMADELTRTDGREVRLEEDSDLHLPFLLPEDGYSCETIRGIPNGLPEFMRQLESIGICRFVINVNSSGSWTVYMEGDLPINTKMWRPGIGLPSSPEIITFAFSKVKGSMGLSIVAAVGEGQTDQGIYIKSVVDGGAAALDGRLQAGDQLLEVDGKSLIGVSQDRAAELMTNTGNVVKLKVAKQAVLYHNLGSLLSQPSPTSQRAVNNRGPGSNRPAVDEGPPPPYDGRDSKIVNGYGNPDRMRAPSTGNIVDMKSDGHVQSYNYRRDDPRSKSTSNLNVDAKIDHRDNRSHMKPAQSVGMLHHPSISYNQYSPGNHPDIRPNDYENQPHYKPANSERSSNEVHMRPSGNNLMDPNQSLTRQSRLLNQHHLQGFQQPGMSQITSDMSSLSSRTSSASIREARPMSAYYDTHSMSRGNQNFSSRPRSEDVGSKLKEWQIKYGDPRVEYKQTNGGSSPPYSNIGVNKEQSSQLTYNPAHKPTAHERLFNQQEVAQKINNNSLNRQPNLYENTLQHQPSSAFHQPQQSPNESNSLLKENPKLGFVQTKIQPQNQNIPVLRIDNQQMQPNFFEAQPTLQNGQISPHVVQQPVHGPAGMLQFDLRHLPQGTKNQQQPDFPRHDSRFTQNFINAPNTRNGPVGDNTNVQQVSHSGPDVKNIQFSNSRTSYPQNQDFHKVVNSQHNSNFHGNRSFNHSQQQYFVDTNNHFGYPPDSFDLPLPTIHNNMQVDLPLPTIHNNMQVDLPTSSYVGNYQQEEPPPVPPPPSHEALIDHRLAEEHKLGHYTNTATQFSVPDPRQNHQYSPNTKQPSRSQPQQFYQQPSTNYLMSPSVSIRETAAAGHQVVQNGYRTNDSVAQPNYQNLSFISEARASSGPISQTSSIPQSQTNSLDNSALKTHGSQNKSVIPILKSTSKDRSEMKIRSAWDRDAKEKAEEEEQAQLFKAREQEIAQLEARPYLNTQDEERLRKLKTEHEFQRRVREIAEKGDYEYDDDEEFAERYHNRERLIQMLKDDLEKSRQRMREFEQSQQRTEISREQDRLQTLERRLEMYETDREEQRQRLQKRQEKRVKEHQDQMRLQKEMRERQRQSYEDHKRQLMKEEEKMNQKREEELNKRRQFENERRKELQDKRDAEEKRIREEIRREDEELLKKQLAKERQQRIEMNRPILVGEEKRRLDTIINSQSESSKDSGSTGFSQYPNVSNQGSVESPGLAPPPPDRKSSYETIAQHQQRALIRSSSNLDFTPSSSIGGFPSSALKTAQEPPLAAKKSVSFNTEMNTYKVRTPNHSGSSYKSAGSQPLDLVIPSNNNQDIEVFESSLPAAQNGSSTNEAHRRSSTVITATSSDTPNVVGANEVYKDPRSRIEAKIASQSTSHSSDTERMSFRDKMKYFASEAGEGTIKYKPKSSKTLRNIESQLNGQ